MAKLLLKLQRTHRRKGAKMLVQRRSTYARNRCQVLDTQRLLVVGTQPGDRLRRPVSLGLEPGNRAKAGAERRLRQSATQDVLDVEHTMGLEDQAPGNVGKLIDDETHRRLKKR
jgi:hypothetical protein